jgi:predicted nucleotidyltransferase component of viral defense system
LIRQIEINEAAHAWGLSQHVVEKDYVIGWLLMGLSRQARLQTQWIFKGGTCLKKCYLETYRFSEDLDFTLIADATLDLGEISEMIKKTCRWVSQESGIELPLESVEFRAAPNPRGGITIRGKVSYRGPLQQPTPPRIQFDLTTDELITMPPVLRPIHHPYSDRPLEPGRIRCYPIEEVLAEKTRAISERCLPRDLYDIIRLYRFEGIRLEGSKIRGLVKQKCAHRNLPMPTFQTIEASPRFVELESEWGNMLRHQIPILPPLGVYWRELASYFEWLDGLPLTELPSIEETEVSDVSWQQPDFIALPAAWGTSAPIETIRFAGANRLCVLLHYRPAKGYQGDREVEPYSFRLSKEGHLLFYGRNIDRPRVSTYRFDRIVDVQLTKNPFVPIWRVEF